METAKCLGDWTFCHYVSDLSNFRAPLVSISINGSDCNMVTDLYLNRNDAEVSITSAGSEVIAGKRNSLTVNGIDKWLGGVHLYASNLWCFESGELVKL